MAHRYVRLPFSARAFGAASEPDRVLVVSNGAVSCAVDPRTGATTPVPGGFARMRRDPASGLGDLRERIVDTAAGRETRLVARDGTVRAVFEGEAIEAARAGRIVVALVALPVVGFHVAVCLLDSDAPPMRLPATWTTALAAGDDVVVAMAGELAHVFRCIGDALAASSIALRCSEEGDARVDGDEIRLLSADRLVQLDARVLATEPGHRAVALVCEPVTPPPNAAGEVATVAFVLSGKILFDHPRLGRLTVDRGAHDPVVARGDRVRIDDVHERLPGIHEVRAWSRADHAASLRPPAPPFESDAPDVHPFAASYGFVAHETTAPLRNAERLRDLAREHGFTVPALLDRLLQCADTDAVFRRWLERSGFGAVEVGPLPPDRHADPNVVAFTGDEYPFGLYVYPPACARGESPPVVKYLDDSNEVVFVARTFEDHLAGSLEPSRSREAAIRESIRSELGFTQSTYGPRDPPSWFPAGRSSVSRLHDARALESRGETLAAERAYLSIYVNAPDDDDESGVHAAEPRREAGDALRRIYTTLGWTLARANLASR